jgi:anti-sigma factor RsiW
MNMSTESQMDCRELRRMLWDCLDGELDPAAAAQVSAHLELWQHCFQVADVQRTYFEAIAALRAPAVAPVAVKTGIVAALAAAGYRAER